MMQLKIDTSKVASVSESKVLCLVLVNLQGYNKVPTSKI